MFEESLLYVKMGHAFVHTRVKQHWQGKRLKLNRISWGTSTEISQTGRAFWQTGISQSERPLGNAPFRYHLKPKQCWTLVEHQFTPAISLLPMLGWGKGTHCINVNIWCCWASCQAWNIRERSDDLWTTDQKRWTTENSAFSPLDRKVCSFFNLCSFNLFKIDCKLVP